MRNKKLKRISMQSGAESDGIGEASKISEIQYLNSKKVKK